MKDRQAKYRPIGFGRRVIVLIAALALCLNMLLPTAVMAMAADAGQPVVVCTLDGFKAVRLDKDGAPLPAQQEQQEHEKADCTLCYACAGCAVAGTSASAASAPNILSAIRPESGPQKFSSNRRSSSQPRGPPRLA
ncbi:MAG: hypothetical protein ISR50_20640 [Alphaproteobacteria bacterium]|nr:hypothetical protein [Alphaproteobacteria bacterium]